METSPIFRSSVSAIFSAHRPRSLLPRTAVKGATRLSASSTPASPMSPAWTMWSAPRRNASASGRSRLWVSERTPTRITPAASGKVTAVDHEGRSHDEGRLVRAKPQDRLGDFFRRAQSTDRFLKQDLFSDVRRALDPVSDGSGFDPARADDTGAAARDQSNLVLQSSP